MSTLLKSCLRAPILSTLLLQSVLSARFNTTTFAMSATLDTIKPEGSPMPTIFMSHGGGPCFFMKGGMMAEMDADSKTADFLRSLPTKYPKPTAILIISAHWEASPALKVQSSASPAMLYDYYGFPDYTFSLKFPAAGSPLLAKRTCELLSSAGITCEEDCTRGFDHGAFVPLLVAYPEADVPVVQLSIHKSLDPSLHLRIGAALAPLRSEGVLIVGSGALTHNLGAMGEPFKKPVSWAKGFVDWVDETLVSSSAQERLDRLVAIKSAPGFRKAHPREDHFVPLFVAVGAAYPELKYEDGKLIAPVGSEKTPIVSKLHEAWALESFALHSYMFN